MAAVLAEGTTVIDNAAREPEIVDLCAMLVAMGARIDGAGTSTITVEGVDSLSPVDLHDGARPDRGRHLGDRCGHDPRGRRHRAGRRRAPGRAAGQADRRRGARSRSLPDGIRVAMDERPRCVDVVTLPFPGFPTDLQPMAVALAAVSTGTALITENVFEGRFMFVNELVRLGADVRIDGHHAVVRGREQLSSAPVVATDIRAGAGLVLAGLVSDGVTEVQEVHHVDRGYPDFVEQLRGLGAQIERHPSGPADVSSAGEGGRQRAGAVGVLGEDQDVGPVRGRDADRGADAGVGEHRAQRQRRLPAGQRGDQREQAVLGGRPARAAPAVP